MFKVKASTLAIHLAGWLLFLSFPLVLMNGMLARNNVFALLQFPYYWVFCACYVALFYTNSLCLIPFFFLKKKYVSYFIIVLMLFIGISFLKPFDKLLLNSDIIRIANNFRLGKLKTFPSPRPGDSRRPSDSAAVGFNPGMYPPPGDFPPPPNNRRFDRSRQGRDFPPPNMRFRHVDTTSMFIFIMIVALSTAVETTRQWWLTEQRASRAEADKANAELSFLKAQINPHFLFNTLNNIYTLAITKSELTADSIMKLSNIMRYVTDDVTRDFVPLQSEMDCITDYMELQRMRLGKNVDVEYSIIGRTEGRMIAPLIFMTFVENIFKYGISKREQSLVQITITARKDSIDFYCSNRIFSERKENRGTGIGIVNTRSRLEHLYPERHLLKISNDGDYYTVWLNITDRADD